MRTINNIKTDIKWEEVNLRALKAELIKRKETNQPTQRLVYCIDESRIKIYYLRRELKELEGR